MKSTSSPTWLRVTYLSREGACLVTDQNSAARIAALLRVPGCQTGRLAPARSNPTSSSTGLSTLSIQPQRTQCTQCTHTSHAVPAGAPHVMLSTFRNLNSHAIRHRMTPHELMRGAGLCVQPHTCLACMCLHSQLFALCCRVPDALPTLPERLSTSASWRPIDDGSGPIFKARPLGNDEVRARPRSQRAAGSARASPTALWVR